jgi:hypothetical protein
MHGTGIRSLSAGEKAVVCTGFAVLSHSGEIPCAHRIRICNLLMNRSARRVIKFNGFRNLPDPKRIKVGQDDPANAPLARLEEKRGQTAVV